MSPVECTTCHFTPCQCISEVVRSITCKKCGTSYPSTTGLTCPKCKFPGSSATAATVVNPLPAAVQSATVKPENVIGRYVCVDSLGKGGMGIVFRAFDKELHRWVAIKFMTALDDEDLKRFRREALVMAKLQHPNIAQIYEVGEHNGRHYIVMQLIDGKSLTRAEMPKLDAILEKFETVCRAVDYAHQQGIVHRDLKPDNIMIDKRGQMFVMDFGLARPQDVKTTMSKSGTIVGTPAFMAPEQAAGKSSEIDHLSDVYGLGATLYWVATGKLPFQSADVYETLMKVVNTEPPAPRKLNPSLPADIETIIVKAMSKEKSRRYSSAADLATDLERYRTGEAITARPASVVYKIRKKITKNPLLSGALAVAVIALFVVFGNWIRQSSQAESFVKTGSRYYKAGDFKNAKECFDKAVALGVSDPTILKQRDECEAKIRELQKAAAYQPFLDQARDYLEAARVLRYQPKWDTDRFQSEIRRARAACDKAPDYPPALFLRGQTFVEEGKFKEGIAEMERAFPNDPLVGRAYFHWYLMEKLANRDGEMMRRKAEALLLDSTAEGLFVRGRYSELESATGSTREIQPLLRGIALLEQAKAPAASDAFQQAVLLAPCSRPAWLWAARGLIEAKLYTEGRLASTKVIELDPDNPVAHFLRGVLNAETALSQQALEDFSKAIELQPEYPEAYYNRGVVHYRIKNLKGAIQDLDRAIALLPGHALAHLTRGQAKYEDGDTQGGEADLKEAIRLAPKLQTERSEDLARARTYAAGGDSLVWTRRGQDLWLERQFKKALEAYNKAIELDASNASAYFGRAVAWKTLGDLKKAMADYDAAIRLNPKMVAAYLNRSSIRSELNDFEGSIEDCDAVIALDPRVAGAYNNRATSRFMLGDVKGAVADCTKALELAPEDADALSNRGKYRGQLGDLEGSYDDLTRAIRKRPNDPMIHLDRGVTLANLGKMDEAMKDFSRAIELKPDYAIGYRNRGVGHQSLRRYAEALRDFEKAVSLDSNLENVLRGNIEECRRRVR